MDLHRMKYDKQDQQGKAAFNERNPHTTPLKPALPQHIKALVSLELRDYSRQLGFWKFFQQMHA
jgi:hypothetical protein